MKIGLFFGSFNPIHTGHLVIAEYMAEFTDFEQVWLVVSPHNPLKPKESLLEEANRLELVRRGIGSHKKLMACDIEFQLPQPSFTINTLSCLRELYPQDQFGIIMGADALLTLPRWKNYEEIIAHHELYIYPRINANPEIIPELKNAMIKWIDAPIMEISASFIREAIKNKKDVRYMLSDPVYNYIREMHFYEM